MKKGFFILCGIIFPALAISQTDSTQLSEVISISKAPITKEIISKSKLSEKNLGQDLPFLIQQTTSAVATSDAGNGIGYTGIRIRGTDASRILVSLDGIPINDSESQSVFWVNMPNLASSLKSIQIQRGVGSSSSGTSAFGASISMFSNTFNPKTKVYYEGSAGSFNTFKNALSLESGGLIKDKLFLKGSISKLDSDGYVDRASSDLFSYQVRGKYILDKTSDLSFNILNGAEKTYQSWYGIDKNTLESDRTHNAAGAIYDANFNVIDYYDNQVDDYKQSHYHLSWNKYFKKQWKLKTTLHYTYGRGFYEEYQQGQTLSDYKIDSNLASDLVRQLWLKNHFYGLQTTLSKKYLDWNFEYQINANQYIGNHFGLVNWVKDLAINNDVEYYRNKSTKNEISTYLKVLKKFNNLELYGDLQLRTINYQGETPESGMTTIDNNPDFKENYTFWNPKIGMNYRINSHKIYAFAGLSNREPTRADILNDSDIKPETLFDTELGFQFQENKLSFDINGYYMLYSNQLVLSGRLDNVGNPLRENSDKSYRLGVEFNGAYKVIDNLKLFGNIGLSSNKNIGFEDLENTSIAFSPNVISNFGFETKLFKIVNIQWNNKYISEQYLSNYENDNLQLDAYFLSDISVQISPKIPKLETFSIQLLFNNIWNKTYESNGYVYDDQPYYYPQAGFNLFGGVTVGF